MAPVYLLEWSPDPLSETSPTYEDITPYFLEGSYQRDGGGDLDDPQAGTATVVLDNRDRRFEPGYYVPFEFRGDFETGDYSQWSSIQAADVGAQFNAVTSPVREGTYAAKFTVRNGDIVSSGERCEVLHFPQIHDGEEFFYGWSTYFPSGFVDTLPGTQFKIIQQFHDNLSVGPPNFSLRVKNGAFEFRRNTGTVDVAGVGTSVSTDTFGAFSTQVWHDWIIQIVWRTASTGLVRVYHKLQSEASYTLVHETGTIPTLQSPGAGVASSTCYTKLGLYRNIFPDTYTDDLYHDGFRIGRSFDEVSRGLGPVVRPLQRMRLSIDGDVEFSGFVTNWGVNWPDSFVNEEATVTLSDGWHVAELESLPALDPADAETYEDVVAFDEPFGNWPLSDQPGTKARSRTWKTRKHFKHKPDKVIKHKRKWIVTRSEAEGVAGPAGTYKNLPGLGASPLILGSSETSVLFTAADSQYVVIQLGDEDEMRKDAISLEAWVKFSSVGGTNKAIILGPEGTGDPHSFSLVGGGASGNFLFTFGDADAAATDIFPFYSGLVADTIYHVVATWNGSTARGYVNGALASELDYDGSPIVGNATAVRRIWIGGKTSPAGFTYMDGQLGQVAIYEKALSPERVLAHYFAGAQRGWNSQSAGARIADILTHPLWSTSSVQTSNLTVRPQMKTGQTLQDEVQETAEPLSVRYFNGDGDPVYLGWDFGDASPYNAVQATFGENTGEVPYEDLAPDYDETIYNDVAITNEDGETQVSTDSDSQDEFRPRSYQRTGLLLTDDSDAALIADTVLEEFAQPEPVVRSMALNGVNSAALTQILTREPGDLVRVKRRPGNGTAIDRVCRIKSKSVVIPRTGPDTYPTATFTFTRGFSGTVTNWQLGVDDFGDLGTSAVLS